MKLGKCIRQPRNKFELPVEMYCVSSTSGSTCLVENQDICRQFAKRRCDSIRRLGSVSTCRMRGQATTDEVANGCTCIQLFAMFAGTSRNNYQTQYKSGIRPCGHQWVIRTITNSKQSNVARIRGVIANVK